MPEVLPAAEVEGFVARVGPEHLEPTEGASVSEDIEESQELAVNATRGAHHAGRRSLHPTTFVRAVDMKFHATVPNKARFVGLQ